MSLDVIITLTLELAIRLTHSIASSIFSINVIQLWRSVTHHVLVVQFWLP